MMPSNGGKRPKRRASRRRRRDAGKRPPGESSKRLIAAWSARAKRSATRAGESARPRLAELGRSLRAGALALLRLLVGAVQEIVKAVVAAGEAIGRLELKVARALRGPLRRVREVTRGAMRATDRAVTPSRAVAAVVLAAAVLLGLSQFVDYRGVGIGVPLYEGVEAVAPPPQTDRQPAGSAHSYVLLPIAVLVLGAMAFALRGRWQLGRAISLLGVIGVAVSLLIDIPAGLDEGEAALGFEGAEAMLVEGFWIQLACSGVLVVTGLLLGRYVRLERGPAARRARRSSARRRREPGTGRAAGVRA
jgi:hypothetical protein